MTEIVETLGMIRVPDMSRALCLGFRSMGDGCWRRRKSGCPKNSLESNEKNICLTFHYYTMYRTTIGHPKNHATENLTLFDRAFFAFKRIGERETIKPQ